MGLISPQAAQDLCIPQRHNDDCSPNYLHVSESSSQQEVPNQVWKKIAKVLDSARKAYGFEIHR